MKIIVKKFKAICGGLFILGTILPFFAWGSSLASCISFQDNHPHGDFGATITFLTVLIVAAGAIFIAMDFFPERYVKEKSRRKWLKTAKWIAIVCIVILVLVMSSPGNRLGFLAHMGIGFWLLVVALLGILFEKKIATALEKNGKTSGE